MAGVRENRHRGREAGLRVGRWPGRVYDKGVTSDQLRVSCGQLLCVGFEGLAVPAELLGRVARSEVGSVVLFRPNVESPSQVAGLVSALRGAAPAGAPLPIAVDQEGGSVQRLRAPLTEWPDMMSVAEAEDPERSFAVGQALGEELALLGIGWNFAPVLDVHTNPKNPIIGRRAFGSDAASVITHAMSFWRGLRTAGVLGCGKHFPGHGDTDLDSHKDLPVVSHPERRLREVELAPFAAAVQADVESLMVAHVVYPALDPTRPASLSGAVVRQHLRQRLGWKGLLCSDDLGMGAVADRWPIEELVREGVRAGVDHFIVRGPVDRQQAAWEALVRGAELEPDLRERVQESAQRVAAFKARLRVPLPAAPARLALELPSPSHQALAASFSRGPHPSSRIISRII
jgi:beta-N-acetylhexosaminidase